MGGLAYNSPTLPLSNFRFPRFINRFCTTFLLPFLQSSDTLRPRTSARARMRPEEATVPKSSFVSAIFFPSPGVHQEIAECMQPKTRTPLAGGQADILSLVECPLPDSSQAKRSSKSLHQWALTAARSSRPSGQHKTTQHWRQIFSSTNFDVHTCIIYKVSI